jgi:hypothetical protein
VALPSGTLRYMISYKELSLVYFSTFEPIDLTPDSIMQRAGVPMLYDSASCCPASKYARWPTCWGAPLSFHASLAATVTPLSRTASRTIGVLDSLCRHAAGPGQRQQALRGEHLDVGPCGATAGAAPGWCLSPRQRGSGPCGSARAGPERQRRGSVTAWPLPQRGRRKAAAERIEHWPMISLFIS